MSYHDAAHPLESDKGVNPVADPADRQGFRSFVVAAAVERIVLVVIGIEIPAQQGRGPPFEFVPGIVDQIARFVPDAERTGAVGVEAIEIAVAVVVASDRRDFQPSQSLVLLQVGGGRKRFGIQFEILDPVHFAEPVVIPGVAFVGADDPGLTQGSIGQQRVGLIHPEDRPRLDISPVVPVAGVQSLSLQAMVLVTQRQNRQRLSGRHVDHRQGVVFL